jgi:molybdopterin molybdotransferase
MKLLTVDTIEQAYGKILAHIKPWSQKTEMVLLDNVQSRILAEDIYAPCNIPAFRRSTVDGYAVRHNDTAAVNSDTPVFLKLVGSVSMGKPADLSVNCGECVYVPTGGMLPNGADAMVMIEFTEAEAADDTIAIYKTTACGAGIIETGEDFEKDKLLLKRGTCICAQEIGALSAAGITNIPVFLPLSLSIISSGDELVMPGTNPAPGEIYDANTGALKALAIKHGYQVVSTQTLPDDKAQLENAVRAAMALSDIVIISGGSSKGDKDYTADVIDSVSKPGVFTHGLAVKPGKPTIFGWDEKSKTLLAGFPGHPVSAMMIFRIIFGWLLEKLFFKAPALPIPAYLSCNVSGTPGRTVYLPVVLALENNSYSAEPVLGKSGMISTLTCADGYIIIDMNKEGLEKDEPVLVHLL